MTKEESNKTVTVEELQRRIAKEQEKHDGIIDNLKSKYESKIEEVRNQSIDEAQKFQEKTWISKLEESQKRIAELEKLEQRRKLRDEAIKALNERSLPVNDESLSFVVKDTAEDTLDAIDKLRNLIDNENKNYVEQYKVGKTPEKISESSAVITVEDFENMSLIEKSKLYEEDKELYDKLNEGE